MNKVKCFDEYTDRQEYAVDKIVDRINTFAETHEIINITINESPMNIRGSVYVYALVIYKERENND